MNLRQKVGTGLIISTLAYSGYKGFYGVERDLAELRAKYPNYQESKEYLIERREYSKKNSTKAGITFGITITGILMAKRPGKNKSRGETQ